MEYWYKDVISFSEFLGKTFIKVKREYETIHFIEKDGTRYVMAHSKD